MFLRLQSVEEVRDILLTKADGIPRYSKLPNHCYPKKKYMISFNLTPSYKVM